MNQTIKNREWSHRTRRRCVRGVLVVLVCFLLPSRSFSQVFRVENFSSSSIGGETEGGSFTLESSAGESVPAGETAGGSFGVRSGSIITLHEGSSAPIVTHTPPDVQPSNQAVRIEAAVVDAGIIERARLLYRRGGDATFTEMEMAVVDGRFQADIPADAATSEGIAYYLNVADQSGRTTRKPAAGFYSIRVALSEPGISMEQAVPPGTEVSAYRIFSIPLDLENKDAETVLVDDLGPYDDSRWRFFELLFDQTLDEFPETAPMTPGKGYWLITSEEGRRIDSGAGTTVDLSTPYSRQLHPGWNLVGTPFNFPVSPEQVRMASGQPFLLRSFTGNWNDPIQEPVDRMNPFSGYAVFNGLHLVDEMLVDPAVAVAKSGGGDTFASQYVWGIRIIAQSGRSRDVDNIAAVAESASNDQDVADYPEPPVIGPFISVSFPHPEWGAPVDRFATDVRSDNLPGYVWDVEVRGNVSDRIHLRFDGVEHVPGTFDVWLVDEILRSAQDLRASDAYVLTPPTADEPRKLQLVVGESEFVDERLKDQRQNLGAFELLPSFPNPFLSGTTIRYVLDQTATVTVKIYDVVGREVAVLAENLTREAGHHTLIWSGMGSNGMSLQSGLYYVQLNASGRVLTTAVVRMR